MEPVRDLAGSLITPGAYLIDDRGKAWHVLETDVSFLRYGLLRVVESRLRRGAIVDRDGHTYARSYMTFVVERPGSKEENRAEWHKRYALFARPRLRAELAARKRRVAAKRRT